MRTTYGETAKQLVVKRLSSTMRRKCACSGLMVSIEFGRSPLLGKLYRRTSGSTGPSKFRRSEKGIKKEPAFVRIINSKFNSSQKRVQSRKRVDSRLAKKIGTYLSRVVRARGKTGSNRNRSVRGSWESGTTEDRSSEELEEARRSSKKLGEPWRPVDRNWRRGGEKNKSFR